jgi:hypothetical protein
MLRDLIKQAERQRIVSAVTYLKLTLSIVLGFVPTKDNFAEAIRLATEAMLAYRATSYRMWEAMAMLPLSRAEICAGNFAAGEQHAAAALEVLRGLPLEAVALASQAHALIGLGRPAEALPVVKRALELSRKKAHVDMDEIYIPLLLFEALSATGKEEEGRAYLVDARRQLLELAQRIKNPQRQKQFLELPHHARVLSLTGGL